MRPKPARVNEPGILCHQILFHCLALRIVELAVIDDDLRHLPIASLAAIPPTVERQLVWYGIRPARFEIFSIRLVILPPADAEHPLIEVADAALP